MRRAIVPALAVFVTGVALYLSRGVLDQVLVNGHAMRVALLPPWHTLVGFVAMAALGLLWMARRTAPRTMTSAPVRQRVTPLTLPAFALVLLIVPFVPWLADAFPALQLLAGPLRAIVWLTVLALIAWTLWQGRLLRADWLQRCTVGQVTLIIGLLTALASGAAAARLTGTSLFPSGDEPHYLVIAQSIWRDGDLKIENNHARGDYREYYQPDLDPHFLTRGADGEIYSIHPIGMPMLMAPVYAAGGYRAVVFVLVVCAALAAMLMWRFLIHIVKAPGAATFAWAAVALTTPFLFNTFAVYPETFAALAVVVALTAAADNTFWPRGIARWLAAGLCCAALPWLSTKYAPMSAALMLIAVARQRGLRLQGIAGASRTSSSSGTAGTSTSGTGTSGTSTSGTLGTATLLAPYFISLAGWFAFFYAIWGTPLPQAPYGTSSDTNLRNLVAGAPGLLFDQEYGVLAYAPVYILAATGLATMWRERENYRRLAIELVLVFTALLATVGAYEIWWGGTAPPGRPLMSALLVLATPIAIASRAAARGTVRHAAQHVLLWVSVAVACLLLFTNDGFLLNNGRDGTSDLLAYLSPRWDAWAMAPTFIAHNVPTALLRTAGWLILATLAAFAIQRWRTRTAGASALTAMALFSAALFVAAIVLPRLPAYPPQPRIDLSARPGLPLLDGFDIVSRPLGVRYDPLRLVSPDEIERLATLDVTPGTRRDPQPIRILHNGRLSLPAGRYRLAVRWGDAATAPTSLEMQVGRTGKPMREWPVAPRPGAEWATEFSLPADASFVGFRGTTELEGAIAHLTVTPLSIVNLAERPKVPPLLGAAEYGPTTVFFHDDQVFQEPSGFWVRGGRETTISVWRDSDETPLVLTLHSGLIANRATLFMRGWSQAVSLDQRNPVEIELPDSRRRVVTLQIRAEHGFNPPSIDPTSTDPRYLGVWVEFPGKGEEATETRQEATEKTQTDTDVSRTVSRKP